MRIDKFLKVSRIIKRRTIANEACDAGRVSVNGKVCKASQEIKAGDTVEIRFGERMIKVLINDVREHTLKNDAASLYTVLENN